MGNLCTVGSKKVKKNNKFMSDSYATCLPYGSKEKDSKKPSRAALLDRVHDALYINENEPSCAQHLTTDRSKYKLII